MGMTVEDSNFILDLRTQVAENKAAGKKARDGISEEDEKKLYALLRGGRASASIKAAEKKTRTKKPPPLSDEEVANLFK
jgi:hypothetical protein